MPAAHAPACLQGDSGGPLFIKGAAAGQDVLVGVVSWGDADRCAGTKPGGWVGPGPLWLAWVPHRGWCAGWVEPA